MHKELQNSKSVVAMYEKQIGSMQGFTSDPLWEPKPMAAAPVQQQAQPVAVACSAGGAGPSSNKRQRGGGLVPDWLRSQCGEYQEANYNQQKVFTNDFEGPVRAYGNR